MSFMCSMPRMQSASTTVPEANTPALLNASTAQRTVLIAQMTSRAWNVRKTTRFSMMVCVTRSALRLSIVVSIWRATIACLLARAVRMPHRVSHVKITLSFLRQHACARQGFFSTTRWWTHKSARLALTSALCAKVRLHVWSVYRATKHQTIKLHAIKSSVPTRIATFVQSINCASNVLKATSCQKTVQHAC